MSGKQENKKKDERIRQLEAQLLATQYRSSKILGSLSREYPEKRLERIKNLSKREGIIALESLWNNAILQALEMVDRYTPTCGTGLPCPHQISINLENMLLGSTEENDNLFGNMLREDFEGFAK